MSKQTLPSAALSSIDFHVRPFHPDDLPRVLKFHAAVASDCLDCDCTGTHEPIQEKYFRRPQDHFWVADAAGEIVGTIAIAVQDRDVAHVHCLRALDDDSDDHRIRRGLVQVAARHARHYGCLKLVIHANVDVGRATQFLHRLGFEFSRHRENKNQPLLEFYLNLYEPAELETKPKETHP